MNPFAWLPATTVEQAARAATATVAGAMATRAGAMARPVAIVKAGGIDLLDLMKEGLLTPATLVSLGTVGGLDGIAVSDAGLRIGARVTLERLAADATVRQRYPALAQAAQASACPQIRHVATLAGNLLQRPRCWYFRSLAYPCLRKGGAHCFALSGQNAYHAVFDNLPCAIVHPSTVATALVALNARIERVDATGANKTVPLESFFVSARQDPRRENELGPGEIVTAVHLPPPRGARSVHLKQGERQAFDWPLVDAAVALEIGPGRRCSAASVVLGAVAPVPHRARAAERALVGHVLDERQAATAAQAALEGATSLAMNAYKLPLIETLVRRALLQALSEEFR